MADKLLKDLTASEATDAYVDDTNPFHKQVNEVVTRYNQNQPQPTPEEIQAMAEKELAATAGMSEDQLLERLGRLLTENVTAAWEDYLSS